MTLTLSLPPLSKTQQNCRPIHRLRRSRQGLGTAMASVCEVGLGTFGPSRKVERPPRHVWLGLYLRLCLRPGTWSDS
jgi:hypothetical protein